MTGNFFNAIDMFKIHPIKNLNGFSKSLRYYGHDILSSCRLNNSVFRVVVSFPDSDSLHGIEDYVSVINYFHNLFSGRVSYLEVNFDFNLFNVHLYVSFF